MNRYIIVKVDDADRNSLTPGVDNPAKTNLAKIRQAVHSVAEMNKISVSDMVVQTTGPMEGLLTYTEVEQVIMIFEAALARATRTSRIR